MKKVVYLVLGITLLIALFLVMRPSPVKVETVILSPGDFIETLSVEGKVRSRTKQIVYAFATGEIENLKVRVGDAVTKGQIITRLDWDRVAFLKSPLTGVITKVFRESGGPVVRGEPIFEVSLLEDLEVVAEMQTQDAIRLSPMGEVKISNWGGEGEIDGEIAQISRAGTVKISALGVEEEKTEVRIKFNQITPELKNRFGDTYHVDVMFIISREKNALTIPLGALFKSGEKWAVYTIKNKRAHLKEVEISKRNDRAVMITAGLQPGDQIILFPGDKIHEDTLVTF